MLAFSRACVCCLFCACDVHHHRTHVASLNTFSTVTVTGLPDSRSACVRELRKSVRRDQDEDGIADSYLLPPVNGKFVFGNDDEDDEFVI